MLRQQQKMPPRAAAGCRRQHKKAACRRECRRRAAKDLIGLVRSCSFGALIRGLQNLESPFKKGFNFVCAKLLLGCAESRFVEPRSSLRGSTDWYFLRRAKSTAKTRRGLRPSGLRGRFKALPKKISAKFSGNTSRNRFFAQNGGEKALNRCEVRVLQRKE